MMLDRETLWIRLSAGAEDGEPVAWARLDGSGHALERGVTPIALLPRNLPCKALVAAERVWLSRVRLPGKRKLRGAALAYALEDRLADAPEAVHAVVDSLINDDGIASVVVVDRAWFAAALATLSRAGIEPQRVLAEPSLLPATAEEWHLIWADPALLLAGGESALLLPGDPVERRAMLEMVFDNAVERPQRVVVHAEVDKVPGLTFPEIDVVAGMPYDWAEAAHLVSGPDLLEGDFARRTGFRMESRAWLPALWLALIFLGLNVFGLLASNIARVWETKQLARDNRALYSAVFPETKMVVDPLRQMRGKVADLRHRAGIESDGDFLPLLARTGKVLPLATRQSVRSVQYRPGALILKLPSNLSIPDGWAAVGLKAIRRPSGESGLDELTLELAS